MNYDKIGNFIALKRKEKKLTQKELALKIGVTDKAVSKWERGLGCPDVSVLEVLATELGVSILEILKGRIIENEVVKVTEANDYVKETLNYSEYAKKNKLKEIFSKIIMFSIILIGIVLITLNIIHILYLNNNIEWNENTAIDDMKESIEKINNNIKIIKNNQGIYSDEDYETIINNLEDSGNFNDLYVLNYNKDEIKINDLIIMDLDYSNTLSTISTYKIIAKYDEDINDYIDAYISTYMLKGYSGDLYPNYAYIIPIINYTKTNYKVGKRIYSTKYMIDSYLYLTKQIIKVGEINE